MLPAVPALSCALVWLLSVISALRAAEPATGDRLRFFENVSDASERGDVAALRMLLQEPPPSPPGQLPPYRYYTTLANACVDSGSYQAAVRMIQLAGPPPPGTPDQAWLAAIAHLQLGDSDAAAVIAARYRRGTPPFEFLVALDEFLEWRRLGPGAPAAAQKLESAGRHIEAAAGNLAQTQPGYHRRFLILRCNISEALGDEYEFAHGCADRAAAFPRRADFLRARLASAPFDQEVLEKAAPLAGFKADETAAWTRYRTALDRDLPSLLALAAAQLAELPERGEFDAARLIHLRLALANRHEVTDPANAAAPGLLQRYAQLACQLGRPADASRALRAIEARTAAVAAERTRYAELEPDLVKQCGLVERALKLIHEQARISGNDAAWLARHVDFVLRHDTLRAAHGFLRRLAQLEPDKLAWKLALADLPDRGVDASQRLADAEEMAQITAARVAMTPGQFEQEPETVLNSPSFRLGLYSEVFARVPAQAVPPARSWMNYEAILAESASQPLLEPAQAAYRRRAFRELVERCYQARPEDPVIAAQHRRLARVEGAQPPDRGTSRPSRPAGK